MRRLRLFPRALVASAALAVLLVGDAAAAPWHAHYERGVRLLREGDAPGAEAELRAALEARPHAGCRVRIYGVKYRDYIPHYELGMALLEQGRESEAAVEFSLEMGDGVIDACAGTKEQALSLRDHVARLALADAPAAQEVPVEPAPPPPPEAAPPVASPVVPPEMAVVAAAVEPQPVIVARSPRPSAPAPPPPRPAAATVDPRSLLQLAWSASMHGPPAILHVTRR